VVSTKYSLHLLYIHSNLRIAHRVVVYTPQLYKNFALKSGEGLSVAFVVIWLVGDLCNLIGASRAGLLPTVIILAGYVRLSLTRLGPVSAFDVVFHDSTPFAIPSFSFKYTIIAG